MKRFRTGLALVGGMCAIAALTGCEGPTTSERFRQLDRQIRELGDQVGKLTNDLATRDTIIEVQRKQIVTLQRLGDKRLDKIYHVTAIKLDRLTGGDNYDGKPGDDGVTVYVQPVDQDGHVLKAAGGIHIELFDLANPDGKRRIGEYQWDSEHARKLWHGRFMTYHYKMECPWRLGPPAHTEITVRAEFTDYLTGLTFREQKLVTVRLK